MSDHGNYAWDFDRPPSFEFYSTFSVGIFQWQQKASGKGLKKSKAMSRVLGYTAEPDRVYEKATEICARLNREQASANNPPGWLRKQFSIPKPDGMVVKRTSNDFTSAQVRAMRLKLMKEHLLPAGFVVGKDATYIRRDGDQVHLINFQGAKYGHEFTVNVGFQYAFIPPLFHDRCLALADFHQLDCLLTARISSLLSYKTDKWFEYGNDRDTLAANLTLCATTCLAAFQRFSERWRDPAALLSDFSGDSLPKGMNARWRCQYDLAFAWIELKTGRVEDAKSRVANWGGHPLGNQRQSDVALQEMLAQCQKRGKRPVGKAAWKSWVE